MSRNLNKGWLWVAVALAGLVGAGMAAAQYVGPSTKTDPYLLPSTALPAGSVKTLSILTVGDSIGGYRLVGIPDGMGAFRSGYDAFTLLLNHELPFNTGIPRAHGSQGAFVSRWRIDPWNFRVKAGRDNTRSPEQVYTWDRATGQYVQGTTTWNRLCSADLPKRSAFLFRDLGTRTRLYLNGEEYDERSPVDADNTAGRAFAHIATGPDQGQAWQLPRLGRMAYENVLASPHPQPKTVVMLMDDADRQVDPALTVSPSEPYVYVGHKQKQGHPIERAGLANGDLHGIQVFVDGKQVTQESNEFGLGNPEMGYIRSGTFKLHSFGDVSAMGGAELQDETIAAGIIRLQRIEDGVWDPRPAYRNDFYFVTTGNFRGEGDPANLNSRLWRLRFYDVEHPELGGTVNILLSGDEGHQMLDNVTMDRRGRLLMQEDVGNNPRLGKVWLYDVYSQDLVEIAAHNPKFFSPQGARLLTEDEESSGIIDASRLLGQGWFLLDVQAHVDLTDPALVEGGQLLAMFVHPHVGMESEADEDVCADAGDE
jgi:hypothetical protein